MPRLLHEKSAWADGYQVVAGIDEAGRGPLAGPVVAAIIQIDRAFLEKQYRAFFRGLDDSKKLTAEARARFYDKFINHPAIRWGVGQSSVEEIDRINIYQATITAMQRAYVSFNAHVDLVLLDGNSLPGLPFAFRSIVDGDVHSFSIAAASVIAKVTRDRIMCELDMLYPHYGFAHHKGYATAEHFEAIRVHGPCPMHRMSFEPVRQMQFQF